MSQKITINIGPAGFTGPGQRPKYRVQKDQSVQFNLVQNAAPVNVYFASGSPFSVSTVPVGRSGPTELHIRPDITSGSFSMVVQPATRSAGASTEVQLLAMATDSAEVMEGKTGDIDVYP